MIFVRGAYATSFALPFGCSYKDRGIRNDSHDAMYVQLLVSQPRDVPQLARADDADREDKLLKGIDGLVTDALKVGGNPLWCVDKRSVKSMDYTHPGKLPFEFFKNR